jgi:hypothetical protein
MNRIATTVAALALLLASASPAHAADDDVVMLVNGGRVRGTVIQEDPAQGVRVRLLDGTFRSIPAKDVKKVEYAGSSAPTEAPPEPTPAPAPQMPAAGIGSIHVEAPAPGTVVVDGGEVGRAPADVAAAAVGRHRVRVEFDDGGSSEKIVLVQGGATTRVMVDLPPAQLAFAARKGIHFGAEAGPVGPFVFVGGGPVSTDVDFGFVFKGFVNFALAPGVDFRVGGAVTPLGGGPSGVLLSIPASFRFNLGSVYTMSVGVEAGVGVLNPANTNNFEEGASPGKAGAYGFIGPTASIFGLRFGEHRQYEITATEGLLYFPGSVSVNEGTNFIESGGIGIAFTQSLTFAMLFGL